jgi:hypothetical protein
MNLVLIDDDVRIKLKLDTIREAIIDKIKEILHIFETKTEKTFIKYICELIEIKIKKDYKINKLDFLFSILQNVMILTDENKKIITDIVEHLVSRKEIRLVPIVERAWHYSKLILLPVIKAFFWASSRKPNNIQKYC